MQILFFFNGSSLLQGTITRDFEVTTEQHNAIVENRSNLTILTNYNSLQNSPKSLSKIRALDASKFNEIKVQSSEKLILGHLNISSIQNKFDAWSFIIDHNVDIFLISETKLDDLFLIAQVLIKGFSASYRFDRNSKCGGLLLYIRLRFWCIVLIVILKLF